MVSRSAFQTKTKDDEQHQPELRRLALPSWLQGGARVSAEQPGDGSLYLCLPCFANENMSRHNRAKETGRPEDWPQVSWATAEVVYDKHGEPFDAEAAVRQGIVKYHQSGDGDET